MNLTILDFVILSLGFTTLGYATAKAVGDVVDEGLQRFVASGVCVVVFVYLILLIAFS